MRILLTFVVLSTLAPAVLAQTPAGSQAGDELVTLKSELSRLRQDVESLRSELAALRETLAGRAAAGAPLQGPGLESTPQVSPETLAILQAQVAEHAQTKVESGSRLPVRLSGTILSTTVYNSGEANWLENPNLTGVPDPNLQHGSMTSTLRQSRIGLELSGLEVGSMQASGALIFDFLGGVPNFVTGTVMGLPRLMYAFGRLDGERTAIEIGQDEVMLAPRDPTSLAAFGFPLFFRSGNLYLRAPQGRVERRLGDDWTVMGGFVAPVAGDFGALYQFAPTAGAGERSERPAFQTHVGFARGDETADMETGLGVSGHYGWRRQPASLDEAWAVALDFNVRRGRVGAAGEYFIGEHVEPFGGAVAQAGRTSGGWLEGRVGLTPTTSINAGFGIDKPRAAVGRLLRSENRSAFGNVIVNVTPELSTSVEYRWLETRVGLVPVRRANHHVNGVFALKF